VVGVSERIEEAIERYLHSGKYDHDHPQWPGQNFWEKAKRGHDGLLDALVTEVRWRAEGRRHAPVPANLDLISWTRGKLKPMVRGLFHAAEHEAVLALLEKSVVFLTTESVERVLRQQGWLNTAWSLANLYLSSVDAELLGPEAPSLVGLSQETACYVSADYFADGGRFGDYVIHEAAHVFHNCKRSTAGLPETRTREWLLEIAFQKRETFAYSCEAYGWMVERARNRGERVAMAEEFAAGATRFEDAVDPASPHSSRALQDSGLSTCGSSGQVLRARSVTSRKVRAVRSGCRAHGRPTERCSRPQPCARSQLMARTHPITVSWRK
jgi:hypothetical protein